MPTIKEQCEKRIRELVPELKELKFGCEVKPKKFFTADRCIVMSKFPRIGRVSNENIWPMWACKNDDAYCYRDELRESEFDIIGSPIQLSDILLTIESKCPEYFFITEQGEINYCKDKESDCIVSHYDLSKSFSDQSEEFYSFLLEIIK